jgi:hypothetical protein
MALTEAAFTELVDGGCPACKGESVTVESYVAQTLPLLGGELYGSPSWGYKGEDLVRGTFRIACTSCDRSIYASSSCPRCEAPAALERVLEGENTFPLPTGCKACGSELVTAKAYVPATVIYEGKRAAKARTQTTAADPGFHAYRVECKACGNAAEHMASCPLCAPAS